ncbi:hypothetical protein Hanom_Chr16g01450921 [Helianthus anomalus]
MCVYIHTVTHQSVCLKGRSGKDYKQQKILPNVRLHVHALPKDAAIPKCVKPDSV